MSVRTKSPLQRFFATVLCLAMLLSLVAVPVTATEIEPADEVIVETTENVEILGSVEESVDQIDINSPAVDDGIQTANEEVETPAATTAEDVIDLINELPTVAEVDAALRAARPSDVNDADRVNAHLTLLTDYKDLADAAEREYYGIAAAEERANVTNLDVLVALKARLAKEVLPKAGDITTVTVAESNIDFNLYNYSRDINKKADGTWRNIASYFIFQNANYGEDDSYVAPKKNANKIGAELYAYNLGTDGYPVMNTKFILEEDLHSFISEESRSFSYLFGGQDYEGGYPGSVVAYENVINTPLTFDPATGYYTYRSAENAVDFSITENKVYVRNYIEAGRDAAAASFNYRGDDHISDFFPFNTIGTDTETLERANAFDNTLMQSYDYHYRSAYATDTGKQDYADYWFGATMAAEFAMPKNGQVAGNDMVFEFSGDDDVLVYIDGILLMDLGGPHPRWDGNINFVNGLIETYVNCNGANGKLGLADINGTVGDYASTTIYENFKKAYQEQGLTEAEIEAKLAEKFVRVGTEMVQAANGTSYPVYRFKNYTPHTFNWFYLERYAGASNFNVKFNLPMVPPKSLTVQKDVETDTVGEEADFIKETVEYKFRVLKANADGTASDQLFVGPFKAFDIYENGVKTGSGMTDEKGYFTLKAGQQAVFAGMLEMLEGETMYVVEELLPEDLSGQYKDVEYEYDGTSGTITNDEHTDADEEKFDTYYTGQMNAEESKTVVFVNRIDTTKLGVLKITKLAHPEANIDASKTFNIQVKLGDSLIPRGSKYHVETNGVSEEKIVDNDNGIIVLKVGQTATIAGIVSGTQYQITEVLGEDADKYNVTYAGTMTSNEPGVTPDQPVVTGSGISGEFPLDGLAEITITNQNVDYDVKIPISKNAIGNTGAASFSFSVVQVRDEAGWPVVEGGTSAGETLEMTGENGSTEISIGYKNTTLAGSVFYYMVSENAGSDSYIYDDTFYIVEVTIKSDSHSNMSAEITKVLKNGTEEMGAGNALNFVNQKTTKVNVSKNVMGIPTDSAFQFVATWGEGNSQTFSLKDGENKTITVPVNADVTITETTAQGYETYYRIDTANAVAGSEAVVTAVENKTKLVHFINAKYTEDDKIVIDYGLPVEVDVLSNDGFPEGTNISLVSGAGKYGTAEVTENNMIRYEFTKDPSLTMDEIEEFTYQVKFAPVDGIETTFQAKLIIIPATTIYYEDSFVTFKTFGLNGETDSNWFQVGTKEEDKPDTVQAEDRPGEAIGDLEHDNLYGYDPAYVKFAEYSGGSAVMTHVWNTVDENGAVIDGVYSTAEFTFKGTGFDVISMTSNLTGTIFVAVTGEGYSKTYMVDTYYGYNYVDGEWVVNESASDSLYQIPVIKVSDLPYGEYSVKITATYNEFFDHDQYAGEGNQSGYDFYLDAIRIYDPANDGAGNETIEDAYVADGEGWPEYYELRNLIIDAKTFNALNDEDSTGGIVFIDGIGQNSSVDDYMNFGPNNELYLAKNQSVVFKLNAGAEFSGAEIAKVQIGVKLAKGEPVAQIYAVDQTEDKLTIDVNTATDLYYEITKLDKKTVVITNTGDGILSITNIKVTFAANPVAAVESGQVFSVSRRSVGLALASLNPEPEIFEPEKLTVVVNRTSVKAGSKVQVTVTTSADVAYITVNGKVIENGTRNKKTGEITWKMKVTVNDPEIQVIAYSAEDVASEAVTKELRVTGSLN